MPYGIVIVGMKIYHRRFNSDAWSGITKLSLYVSIVSALNILEEMSARVSKWKIHKQILSNYYLHNYYKYPSYLPLEEVQISWREYK